MNDQQPEPTGAAVEEVGRPKTAENMRKVYVSSLTAQNRVWLEDALQNRKGDCECGACHMCVWQYLGDCENARVHMDSERGARMNAEQTLRAINQLGQEVLQKHEIAVTVDGAACAKPDPGQVLGAFDAFAASAKEQVVAANVQLNDAKAARKGYADLLEESVKEQTRQGEMLKRMSGQTDVMMGVLAQAIGRPQDATKKTVLPLVGVLVQQRDEAVRTSLGLRLFMDTLVRGTCPMNVSFDLAKEDQFHTYTGSDRRTCVLSGATLQKVFAYLDDGPLKFAMPGDVAARMMEDSKTLVPKLLKDRANVQTLMASLAKIQKQLTAQFPGVVWEGKQSTDIAWQLICAGCLQDQDLRKLEDALLKAQEEAPMLEQEKHLQDESLRNSTAEMLARVQSNNNRAQTGEEQS